MRKWLVVVGFDDENDARDYANSVKTHGFTVMFNLRGITTLKPLAGTIEQGPYQEEQ